MTTINVQVGDYVALINFGGWGPRRIAKRRVTKVRKDGKFVIEGYKDVTWRTSGDRAGNKDKFSRTFVEPWTIEHEQEILKNRACVDRNRRFNELKTKLNGLHGEHLTEDQLITLELAMKVCFPDKQ